MKRLIAALIALVIVFIMAGVSFRGTADPQPPKKHAPSCGYTIIEFGLGVDCNGDTVKIIKKNGAQVLRENN